MLGISYDTIGNIADSVLIIDTFVLGTAGRVRGSGAHQ